MRYKSRILAIALAVSCAFAGEESEARRPRMVYNPVTNQTEPEMRSVASPLSKTSSAAVASHPLAAMAKGASPVVAATATSPITPVSYSAASCGCGEAGCADGLCGLGPACGDGCCGDMVGTPMCGCGDTLCGGCGIAPACFYTGVEFTILKPRFSDNIAYTFVDGNVTGDQAITDVQFDHDAEFTPRAYFGWRHADGVGLRVTWWGFDHKAKAASASPEDGFDEIRHPAFAGIDLSTVLPGDLFVANSDLEAHSIDIEATHDAHLCGWEIAVGGGVRYAEVEQGYSAQLIDTTASVNPVRGAINYRQSIEGFGPTISLGASRQLGCVTRLFCKARGSVLFGDGESFLSGSENTPAVSTTRTTSRDDLMSIGEMQVGLMWRGSGRRGLPYQPFLSLALEGQVWNGVGSATSEEGTLGFFGFNSGVGLEW
ncbi:Lpg1974 family pore-forming outer membrane protein [Botrimarina hoheduenensis]|uniref:Uncharacterized protein n=1 Tax=Botrimarina hoheduenensis TaxID=2528000 RepID=A0A5C5VRK0_9BACT|nr:Lpg1974 family pore-forming outer membrane protein [Botrimarina hoheduenensis]TWT40797.1 hypothetical protein Pla111_32150 [Botrimarina hoheduenensis]